MKKTSISVTEAARNFADCVNRAYYQNTTFVLLRNGLPVAQLVPGGEKVCRGADLEEVLSRVSLTDEEARLWRKDLGSSRKAIKPPVNKWG
jgi:hypothetical protein